MTIHRCLSFSVFLMVVSAAPVGGQTTFATITGHVTDSVGGVIPGAVVEARHLASNYTYTTTTNQVGLYTLGQLREGEYELHVRLDGFKEFVARNIQLVAQDLRRIDVRLEVGAIEAAIEVTAGATLIETETARISDSKDAHALKVLPLNTRQLWDYLSLTPGVVQAGGASSTRRFAGSRANQSDASIDGITVTAWLREQRLRSQRGVFVRRRRLLGNRGENREALAGTLPGARPRDGPDRSPFLDKPSPARES